MTAKTRRPPPGGMAGAVEVRLRGVEPDAHHGAARRTLHLPSCLPSRLTATQCRRAHFIGSLRAAAPMLSVVHRSAAFFDLDKTIIARSSALAFGRPFRAGALLGHVLAPRVARGTLLLVDDVDAASRSDR